MTDATATFVFCEPSTLFSIRFIGCKCKSHTPYFVCAYMYATIDLYSLHGATPTNPLLLWDSKSATLAVCQGTLYYKACAADLYLV